jgi:cellulose synthase/poly-beta-1,6-N-acetylglucosamine synthase-like glycosyltransferase
MVQAALRVINESLLQPPVARPEAPLGRFLVEDGVITSEQLIAALESQFTIGAPVGEIVVAEGWAKPADIQRALGRQLGLHQINLDAHPPELRLCKELTAAFCLKHRLVPWLRLGPTVLVATADPARFKDMRPALDTVFGRTVPVVASATQVDRALSHAFKGELAAIASTRVEARFSCRDWRVGNRVRLICILGLLAGLLYAFPFAMMTGLSAVAILSMALYSGLKALALLTHLHTWSPDSWTPAPDTALPRPIRLPKVSVLVPLYKEREIASILIERIAAIAYPRALLDVVFVLEAEDKMTQAAIDQVDLPSWMRVVVVPPHHGLTTKPRAMNYALDFCRGEIIGIWDAEDAPEPDQINRVVAQFETASDDVVCLQGFLDYYNPCENWLSRCFTLEYAGWFRVVLSGMDKLRLVMPLGGTTLFIRRDKLEELGGWDAQNVTEDADLGVRLARAGYRTEMVETTTYEEANCRPWPWVKQRSRWLKGFMVTYLVHMRSPSALLADLGVWRFLGVQAFFLGTICQFLLAPVIWTYWLVLFGLPHPVADTLPTQLLAGLVVFFLTAEVLNMTVASLGAHRSGRGALSWWAPTMMLYFPLGTLAAYKALWELICAPFYWDKTQHGLSRAT